MVATQNQQATSKDNLTLNTESDLNLSFSDSHDVLVSKLRPVQSTSSLFPSRIIAHNPKAGLNLLVDAASYLFSVLGKLKNLQSYRQLSKLQSELVQEFALFQEAAKNHGYNPEYIIVCRYILCATFDDFIINTSWGEKGQWDNYSLLSTFKQDTVHQDKFFTILERAIKEPALYIDLMELIYICLSMGYKGQYRKTEHSQYQLEQITNNLYKHIRAYRGSFTKTLSPIPLKTPKATHKTVSKNETSVVTIFFVTACIVMGIFVSLGYLMDVISNEAYKNITQIDNRISRETAD